MKQLKRIYLDYAATTPVDSRVVRAMTPYFKERFGNPGSLHGFGQEAMAALDKSREIIAKSIGADFREIIFTSSATEANNLAIKGIIKKSDYQKPRIIISAIEHESVIETAHDLEKEGVEVIRIPVRPDGIVDIGKIKESLNKQTILVSIMYANNEIGRIQPIAEIVKIIDNFKKGHFNAETIQQFPLFHTDAAQALQFLDCNVKNLGMDMMTLSAHKIYGPKGAGALYVKNSAFSILDSVTRGGGQEFGLRSGTENVPAIVGFAKAVELLAHSRESENKRLSVLRDRLWGGIKKICPKAELNGSIGKAEHAVPNILNVHFPGYQAQDLLTRFDLNGLAVSSGSACRSRAMEASYVIEALGHKKERAKSSIRFSLGRPTTKAEIGTALKIIKNSIG